MLGIAEYPADWHMLQPQWLADLSDERRARLLASVVTVGMCASAWFAYEAGHHGGELVYELGAAEAYTPDSPR